MQATGAAAFSDTLTSGGCVAKLLNDLSRNQTAQTAGIYSGAVSCLLGTYLAVRDAGYKCKSTDPEIDAFLQSPGSVMAAALTQKFAQADGGEWLSVRLSALVAEVVSRREKISRAPAAAAPPAPEPLAVRVVGMPDRVTETSVKYDGSGNIKSTVQTESDVAPSKV